VIVPDSIEPYYGYKALRMSGGTLVSPSQPVVWPKKEPLKSECKVPGGSAQPPFNWKLVPAPEGWDGSRFWVSSHFLAEGSTTFFAWPSKEPPEGHTWIPEPAPHDIGKCKCGIYAVDHAKDTSGYMQGGDRVIVEVALWGQVVIANNGARGQYAYPQKLFAAEQQAQQAAEIGNDYGIPVEIVRFLPKENTWT
jgi:hypothetical protein